MEVLIPCIVFYLLVYDRDFLTNSISYFDDVYASKKTAYDVLLDTIMSCGKAGELYLCAGLSASDRERNLRTALYLALTKCVDAGYLQLLERGAFLTPDNAERIYPRLIRLTLRILGEPLPPSHIKTYSENCDYVKDLPLFF